MYVNYISTDKQTNQPFLKRTQHKIYRLSNILSMQCIVNYKYYAV